MVGEKLHELACVQQHRVREAVCRTIFDPLMELLWTASAAGSLHSHICPALGKYSVFGAHKGSVVGLLLTTEGVISVSGDAIRMHTRGGIPIHNFSDKLVTDMLCCEWERPAVGRVLLGHSGNKISVLDLSTSSITPVASLNQGISVIKSNGRLLACGGIAGELSLKDLRTMKTEHTVDAYRGKITSLDLKGDLLVCCGLAHRLGQLVQDPVIKVFDVRQTVRPLAHIPFAHGASTLHFQPKFSSVIVATAFNGAILVTDVQCGGTDFQTYQVDCGEDFLVTSDVSNSGELLAFGDSGGFVHVWGTFDRARVNLFSQPTELPEVPSRPQVPIAERDSFSFAYQPVSDTPFSSVDSTLPIRVGLPPRIVDRSLLQQMQEIEFVKVVQNPHWQRGTPFGDATRASVALRNARQKRKTDIKMLPGTDRRPVGLGGFGTKGLFRLPKGYRRVEVKLSQKLKFEEFDFSYYNKTKFAGLENDIINSYCNALLQVLYFIPQLKATVTAHICEREFCLTCELGFVLHMLGLARGETCQPSNLLRALKQIREASALGLVEGPEELENGHEKSPAKRNQPMENIKERSLAKRIQSFNQFLLEQLHKEAGGVPMTASNSSDVVSQPASISHQLFGMTYRMQTKCVRGSHDDLVQERHSFQVDLQYPAVKSGLQPAFAELLERSLCKQEEMRTWCPHCRSYLLVQQIRTPCNLPTVLIINSCIREDAEFSFWQKEVDQSSNTDGGRSLGSKAGPNSNNASDAWLPFRINISVDSQSSRVKVTEYRTPHIAGKEQPKPVATANNASLYADYELTAMIAHIRGGSDNDGRPQDEGEGHLVAHVKIPPVYHQHSPSTSAGAPAGGLNHPVPRGSPYMVDWVLFNDFCIGPSSAFEVVNFYGRQKIPCLLYYTRVDDFGTEMLKSQHQASAPTDMRESPITEDLFIRLISEQIKPLREPGETTSSSFISLDMKTELPRPGMLLGIDAEFVALSAAEKGFRDDGTEFIKRPPRLGLARVSVVRGEGDKAGVCCIDDYISTVEPVHDYLTRYSGVSPGDLDSTTSKHPITTLKKAYLKLRYLVDKGCRFVGHGLKKDFRMINIVVPQDQIIDTVELFHLKRQRKLSLRFLASYLLNVNIQNQTHDSIEDACTALRLYGKYKELVASGEFPGKKKPEVLPHPAHQLQEIYRYGRTNGWETFSQPGSSKDPDPAELVSNRSAAG